LGGTFCVSSLWHEKNVLKKKYREFRWRRERNERMRGDKSSRIRGTKLFSLKDVDADPPRPEGKESQGRNR